MSASTSVFCIAELPKSSDRMLLVCAHPSMLQWAAALRRQARGRMDSTFNVTSVLVQPAVISDSRRPRRQAPAMFAVLSLSALTTLLRCSRCSTRTSTSLPMAAQRLHDR
jgi:hypothetical protein